MTTRKPFSQACENNKAPILEVLRTVFVDPGLVLEIGSGTGQHAVHFAAGLPHRVWQPTDQHAYLSGCRQWVAEAALANLREPVELDVRRDPWPVTAADGVFSANTAHIMHWPAVEAMFAGVARVLTTGGAFCLYGPFCYDGEHTSASNTHFDSDLRARDPGMGIRDVADLTCLAGDHGLALVHDHAMPANNRTLVFR
ncbi:DUF938 domain-containing protein [Arhodomonas sp. AD133]|uniref:DUF938 domain-containing protein n=1 Tax=Arhodomonas sp. AD133 TaxID=3415009 RepID=UPI003EBF071C